MPVVLYERQRQILDFLSQYIQRNGFAPSLRDIADAMNLSSLATVHEHLNQLSKKGVIRVGGRGKHRVLEIVDEKMAEVDKGVKLPIVGFFSQGAVIEPYATPHAFLAVAPSMVSGVKRGFALHIKDDSLAEEGIFENDFMVAEETSKVTDGNVIIALLENNVAVLKRFFQEATRVKLESLRQKQAPLYTTKIKVQGKLIALVRKF